MRLRLTDHLAKHCHQVWHCHDWDCLGSSWIALLYPRLPMAFATELQHVPARGTLNILEQQSKPRYLELITAFRQAIKDVV